MTAFIGPSGCGKSTVLRTINRMHEVIAGARVEGEVLLDGEDIYGAGVDPVSVRRTIGMVFQRPNPFPTMSIYDNVVAGLKLQGVRNEEAELDEVVEQSLQRRKPVERGQGPARQARRRAVRRPAAAAVHRPGDRGAAAGAADGRAVLGAGPDLDAGDRGPDPELKQKYTIVIVTHNMQQAARVSERPRSSTSPAAGKPGQLVEIDDTEKIFSNPREAHRGLHLRPVRGLICQMPTP